MAKPSFIWTFWLAISQAWKVWPQLSFHENEENNVLRKIRFGPRGSTCFSASIEILVSWTFRLAHIPAYNTYMYPLHRPLHHSPDIRFVWKEREKEKMSERERERWECGAATGARISRFLRLVLLSRFVGHRPIDRLGRLRTGFLRSNAIETRLDYYFCIFTRAFVATTASIGSPIREATGNVASSLELAYFLLSFSLIFVFLA